MNGETRFYAHSIEGEPPEKWQLLETHLLKVAKRASSFAASYEAQDWAYCAGLWHDVGKYQQEFQQRLRGSGVSVEHSGAGAALAQLRDRTNGLVLAFIIAGHHAGLANLIQSEPGLPTALKERLANNKILIKQLLPTMPPEINSCAVPTLPCRFTLDRVLEDRKDEIRRTTEFWTRFVFSALVDADRLDTESFVNPSQSELRRQFSSIQELGETLDSFVAEKQDVSRNRGSTTVNDVRSTVLRQCQKAAESDPGFFSLTAPTGSGKTLSAMSFALRHAKKWGFQRVIVVIPYTSIIEQNAQEYRTAMGARNIIEHHSNLDLEQRKRELGEEVTTRQDLAAENWDAPVIVTTTVQFFESLFSNHPSRCRKLHNIARSVVILDEVQTLPPGFLLSIVEALNELVSHYGCTIVLSTATPPALGEREGFRQGLKNLRPIIADSTALNLQLQRVKYSWPEVDAKPTDWPMLASEMSKHDQVLAVVHRRKDARILALALMQTTLGDSVVHLSALMCPAHRSEVLIRIRERLAKGMPCRLVSTQLVEAGVDVDFPVVYRCLGGLDSIVQAAGRCNREGLLEKGNVVIFRAPTPPPRGTPHRALEVTESLLREHSGNLDLSATEIFDKYFRMLYAAENLDRRHIQVHRQVFNFASVGREFQLIEDGFSVPIVVPYGEGLRCPDDIRCDGPTRENMRRVQRFMVNIYRDAFSTLSQAGAIEEISEGVYTLTLPYHKQYDPVFGLMIPEKLTADSEALIV